MLDSIHVHEYIFPIRLISEHSDCFEILVQLQPILFIQLMSMQN